MERSPAVGADGIGGHPARGIVGVGAALALDRGGGHRVDARTGIGQRVAAFDREIAVGGVGVINRALTVDGGRIETVETISIGERFVATGEGIRAEGETAVRIPGVGEVLQDLALAGGVDRRQRVIGWMGCADRVDPVSQFLLDDMSPRINYAWLPQRRVGRRLAGADLG